MSKKPQTINEYLSTVSADKRAALQKLRKAIKSTIPKSEECISYGMPAFRVDGKVLVWFGAGKNHCAFYPGSSPIELLKDELTGYETSKGTIRFSADRPLPATLVRKLVKARRAQRLNRP